MSFPWGLRAHLITLHLPYEAFGLTMSDTRLNRSFQGGTLFSDNATYFSILKTTADSDIASFEILTMSQHLW